MDFTCKRGSWKVIENGIDRSVVQSKLGRSKFQPAACKKKPAHGYTTFNFSDSHTPIIFTFWFKKPLHGLQGIYM